MSGDAGELLRNKAEMRLCPLYVFLSFLASPAIRSETLSILACRPSKASCVNSLTRRDASICVSSSLNEPEAWLRNCKNSFVDFLAAPSARLPGTDKAARRIWDTKPKSSSRGNPRVARYSSTYKSIPFCQANNERCGLKRFEHFSHPLPPQSLNHFRHV